MVHDNLHIVYMQVRYNLFATFMCVAIQTHNIPESWSVLLGNFSIKDMEGG